MNKGNVSGDCNTIPSSQPDLSDVRTNSASPPASLSNLTHSNISLSSPDADILPSNVLHTLNVILNHAHRGLIVKELPQGSFVVSVTKNKLSCPSLNVTKTMGKRVRDNSLGSWNDTWLPISQFEFNNDNSVAFSDPLMTIRLDELQGLR